MQEEPTQEARRQARQLFHKGVSHMTQGESEQAEACFRMASSLCPALGEAQVNLGWILEQRGNSEAAEQAYRQALLNGVHAPEVFMNLGGLEMAREQLESACTTFEEGLAHHPDSARLWSNLGMAKACMKQDTEAENCYRTALQFDPGLASARFNLAYVLLRHGQYEEGFDCLEARDWYSGLHHVLTEGLGISRWAGESIRQHTILITCEAGHGDMIQFCRYTRQLKLSGARRIGILCHPGLVRLFGSLREVDDIYAIDTPIPPGCWDFWSPALSQPHLCGTTAHNLPAEIPYLQAEPADIRLWQQRLPGNGLKVGLVWRGNPGFENDRHRSLPGLQTLIPLWSVPGVRFISMQKGPGENDVSTLPAGLAIMEPAPELRDFADTAALLANLDLLISVDTGCAHLAGALGIPCWILLPAYKTDWRWLTEDRTDSPWYPETVRLFRQRQKGDWHPVVADLTRALQVLAQSFDALP